MLFAQTLLERGEREVVLELFERCHRFRSSGCGKLEVGSEDVRCGRPPSFGMNFRDR